MNNQKRKNISFTPQHKLEDAEQEYIEAIYRFRRAEKELSADYASSKREILRLEAKVRAIRQHIYGGKTFKLFEPKKTTNQFIGCPEPAWGAPTWQKELVEGSEVVLRSIKSDGDSTRYSLQRLLSTPLRATAVRRTGGSAFNSSSPQNCKRPATKSNHDLTAISA